MIADWPSPLTSCLGALIISSVGFNLAQQDISHQLLPMEPYKTMNNYTNWYSDVIRAVVNREKCTCGPALRRQILLSVPILGNCMPGAAICLCRESRN